MRIADTSSLEARIELSTHVVKCKIISITSIILTETHELNFTYEVEVEDIFLNSGVQLNTGDIISVSSSEGILPASEAFEKFGEDIYVRKTGMFDRSEYYENEYVISSNYNAIPIEIENEYIIFLTDAYLESEHVFAESGYSYLYKVKDGYAFSGIKQDKVELESDVLEMIIAQIEERTGRADEIGYFAYISELGKKQKRND